MLYSVARENFSDQVTFEQGFERIEGVIHVPIGENACQVIKNKCKGWRARLAQQNCRTVGRPLWLEQGNEGCLEGDEIGRVTGDLSADNYCEDLGLLWGKPANFCMEHDKLDIWIGHVSGDTEQADGIWNWHLGER